MSFGDVGYCGICREYAVEAGQFIPLGIRDVLYDYRFNGKSFNYKGGRLPFTDIGLKREYTTHFGPSCDVCGRCVYGSTIDNYSSMLLRIVGEREMEELKTLNNLKINPFKNHHRLERVLHAYYSEVKLRMLPFMDLLGDNLEEQIKAACDKEHPKYKLRLRSIKELMGKAEMLNGLFMEKIAGKIKVPEFAKVGKKPRLIGDYSCPGSLLAGFLVPILKYAFSVPTRVGNSYLRFVYSTDANELDSIFTEIDNSDFDQFVFFSDDMVARIHDERNVPRWYNLDISSCDSSNGPAVFERVKWFFDSHASKGDLIDRAVQQCQSKLVIYHPHGKKKSKEVVTARCSQPIEFSGTQLTTLLNNVASSAICISIEFGRNIKNVDQRVAKRALAVGYEVTIQHCDDVEDIQFLKHSFWRNQGRMASFVNIGPVLRGMGTCWMDLPFNTKLGETIYGAARMRNWSVLQGFKNSGLSILIDHLGKSPGYKRPDGKYKVVEIIVQKEKYQKMYFSQAERVPAPAVAIMKRYGLQSDELSNFCAILRNSDLGERLCHSVIDKIMAVDYGYKTRTSPVK